MNQVERRPGHNVPGCRGDWVELTTLTDSVPVFKCTGCSAVLKGSLECGMIENSEGLPPEEEENQAGEGQRPSSLPLWLLLAVIVVCAIAAWSLSN